MERTRFDIGAESLKRAGYKVTPQRTAILELFASDIAHWTPQGVFQALTPTIPSLSLATVYNTIEVFDEVGIVKRVTSRDGTTYFDTNLDSHFHGTCQRCGALFDVEIPNAALEALLLETRAVSPGFGQIHQVADIRFDGICPPCDAHF